MYRSKIYQICRDQYSTVICLEPGNGLNSIGLFLGSCNVCSWPPTSNHQSTQVLSPTYNRNKNRTKNAIMED